VQPGAGVRLRCADDAGDFGVREAGEEFQRHQLALAGPKRRDRRLQRGAPDRDFGAVVGRDGVHVLELAGERHVAPPPAQLVERRVPRDPEQPGAPCAAPRVEAPPAPVRPFERLRRDILGRGAVAQQPGGIRVDVVPVAPV